MSGYTKLFASIVTSTIWREPLHTKVVWVTLLALADYNGYVAGSVPGLAHMAGVSIDECIEALEKLRAPDTWSRSKEHEGRRIEDVEGGWRLLNFIKYRELRVEAERRERNREAVRRHRERKAGNVIDDDDSNRHVIARNTTNTKTDTNTDNSLSLPRAREEPLELSDEHRAAIATLEQWLPTAGEAVRAIVPRMTTPASFVGFVRSLREPIGGTVYADDAIARGLIELCVNEKHVDRLSSRQIRRYVQDAAAAIAEEKSGAPRSPNGKRDESGALEGEAADLLVTIRNLITTHDTHGNGAKKYLRRSEVEKLGPAALHAFDVIGGSARVIETSGEKWGLVIRDFTKAYIHARGSNDNGD